MKENFSKRTEATFLENFLQSKSAASSDFWLKPDELRGLNTAMERPQLGDAPQVDHDHAGKTPFYWLKADIFLVYDLLMYSPKNFHNREIGVYEFTVHFMSIGPLEKDSTR